MNKTKNKTQQESQGAVPKVSKGADQSDEINDDLACQIEDLALSPDSSDDAICKSDWLKARDSLENLLSSRSDKPGDVTNSKSTSCTTSKDKYSIGESPHSESLIGACSNSVSKVLSWDPWDKLGRKIKKKNKKRRHEEKSSESVASLDQRKDYKSGDEACLVSDDVADSDLQDYASNYDYPPYQPKTLRTVDFTNKVMVVYIKDDRVIGVTTEPLKKEMEQQMRNKEMRRGHSLDNPNGKSSRRVV